MCQVEQVAKSAAVRQTAVLVMPTCSVCGSGASHARVLCMLCACLIWLCACWVAVLAGNICIYCPGGPDSDFEYSTQSYTGYEPTSMRAIRARYNPYVQVRSSTQPLHALFSVLPAARLWRLGSIYSSTQSRCISATCSICVHSAAAAAWREATLSSKGRSDSRYWLSFLSCILLHVRIHSHSSLLSTPTHPFLHTRNCACALPLPLTHTPSLFLSHTKLHTHRAACPSMLPGSA